MTETKMSSRQLEAVKQREQFKLEALNRRMQTFISALNETESTMKTLNSIKEMKKDQESIMIELGSGIFIEGTLKTKSKVKRSLAGSVLIDSSVKEALEQLEEVKKELNENLNQIAKEQNKLINSINSYSQILREGYQKARDHVQKKKEEK